MHTQLDHIVVTANTLEQGVAYIEKTLGVSIPQGGEHPLMGTRNHLMQLGNDVFLEVIAINPDAPSPEHPRWYGLDDPYIDLALKQSPCLLTWVINTTNIAQLKHQAVFDIGEVTPVSRGDLHWLFGIPDDGRILAGGALPYTIQWQTDAHPASQMTDLGCHLRALEIYHPYPEWLTVRIDSLNALDFVCIKSLPKGKTVHLVAHIETPDGLKQLGVQP